MLAVIGMASAYGVSKSGRDQRLRDRALVQELGRIIVARKERIEDLGGDKESSEGELAATRGRIEAIRGRIEARRRRVEAANKRIRDLRQEE
jgi:hypothetical protein